MGFVGSKEKMSMKMHIEFLQSVVLFLIGCTCMLFSAGHVYCKFCGQSENQAYDDMTADFGYACTNDEKCSYPIILLSGMVKQNSDKKLAEQMRNIIRQHPEVTTVCFDSVGGYNSGAVALSNRIIQLELNTCLAPRYRLENKSFRVHNNPVCASLCGWLLSAGKHRIAFSPTVKVGFHASARHFHECLPTHFAWKQESAKSLFAEGVLSPQLDARHESPANRQRIIALLEWSFSIDPRSMKWKTAKELMDDFGYFDELVEQDAQASAEDRQIAQISA